MYNHAHNSMNVYLKAFAIMTARISVCAYMGKALKDSEIYGKKL